MSTENIFNENEKNFMKINRENFIGNKNGDIIIAYKVKSGKKDRRFQVCIFTEWLSKEDIRKNFDKATEELFSFIGKYILK